jgi:hypothetical protein
VAQYFHGPHLINPVIPARVLVAPSSTGYLAMQQHVKFCGLSEGDIGVDHALCADLSLALFHCNSLDHAKEEH